GLERPGVVRHAGWVRRRRLALALLSLIQVMTPSNRLEPPSRPLRVGIGGPVGSGKAALVEALCKRLRDTYDLFVITNDIYTKEDQLILTRAEALAAERIMGVE